MRTAWRIISVLTKRLICNANTDQIKVNDTVTDQSGRNYAVKALNPYENFDNVTHSHYVLELAA